LIPELRKVITDLLMLFAQFVNGCFKTGRLALGFL